MSIIYNTEQKTRESGEQYTEKQLKGWARWAAYITTAAAIGIGANHFTGDPSGLEKLVLGKPAANLESRQDMGLNVNMLKANLLKQNLGLVLLEWDGKYFLAGAKLLQPLITDNSYTGIEKLYFLDYSGFPKVSLIEPGEAFYNDLKAGKVSIAIGYATTQSTSSTQQSGQNPLQGFQRILR